MNYEITSNSKVRHQLEIMKLVHQEVTQQKQVLMVGQETMITEVRDQ